MEDMKGEGNAASAYAQFEAEANNTVLIFELIKAVHHGQDNIPPHVQKLLGGIFKIHGYCVQKWMEKEGLNESQLRKLLMKSKKGLATQITALKAALSTSCGKAYHQTKELADAATDTDDLVQTATVGTVSLPIESAPSPATRTTSHNNDENGVDGSMVDDECMGGGESSDDDEEDDDKKSFNGESGVFSLLSDSGLAPDATEDDGVRRSTRQRPAPQAFSPSPPPKPKKAKGGGKKKGKKKKTTTAKLTADKDTCAEKTTNAGAVEDVTSTVFEGRDLAERLEQLELTLVDIKNVESTIEELQQKLDELAETDGGGQDGPPQYIANEIAIIKMMVEVLKQFRRGDVTINELKQSIADFLTSLEPYQEVVDQLLVLENKTIAGLKSEQSFNIKGKTLGEALKDTEKDDTSNYECMGQTETLEHAREVIKNAQEATETSSKTSLLERLRQRNTMRNTIRFLLNFRVAIDVLEGGTIADFLTSKKDKKNATNLAKEVGALDCASVNCNAMEFFSKVIFQCDEDNSSAKVELFLAFIKGMKGFKRNEKLKDLYGKAATLDITTGEYKGESDFFDGKNGEGRINLPSMAFMIAMLGGDIDKQLLKLRLLATTFDFTASLIGTSIREMEKIVGFVTKKKFWTGIFDAVRTSKFDSHKLTKGDVCRKLDDICEKADEKMDDYQRKYMLLPVDNSFVKALIRFRNICAKRHTKS